MGMMLRIANYDEFLSILSTNRGPREFALDKGVDIIHLVFNCNLITLFPNSPHSIFIANL